MTLKEKLEFAEVNLDVMQGRLEYTTLLDADNNWGNFMDALTELQEARSAIFQEELKNRKPTPLWKKIF